MVARSKHHPVLDSRQLKFCIKVQSRGDCYDTDDEHFPELGMRDSPFFVVRFSQSERLERKDSQGRDNS